MVARPPDSTPSRECLKALLDRLDRPFIMARRFGPRGLQTIKNLDQYISSQVVTALGQCLFPQEIEANLLVLRALFQDAQDRNPEVLKQRLQQGRALLRELREQNQRDPREPGDRQNFQGTSLESKPKAGIPVPSLTRNEQESPDPKKFTGDKQEGQHDQRWDQRHLSEIPIQFAKGIGPKRAALLEKLNIRTVEDGLWFLPWRYEDRSQIVSIQSLSTGSRSTISGVIQKTSLRRTSRRGLMVYTIAVRDETGTVEAVFFNQPYLEHVLVKHMRVMLSGTVSVRSGSGVGWQMRSPQYETMEQDDDLLLHAGRIVPVYHETRGLSSRHLRWMTRQLLDRYGSRLEEILTDRVRQLYRFPRLFEALAHTHFPPEGENLPALNSWQTSAHRRLAFEECFVLQVALAVRQQTHRIQTPGIRFNKATPLLPLLRKHLSFRLTASQEQVIKDILEDMKKPHPMNRLVQGDVGSGKTIVALHAMIVACGSGYQAALMAPTETLAEQHFMNIRPLVESLNIRVAVMKGGMSSKARATLLDELSTGRVQLIVGTHALLESGVRFDKLGLVIVDEQHKFGVLQRAALRSKGLLPDVLVMTATPIPRTLAMTVYGDLEVSYIQGLPPGRKPVRTRIIRKEHRARAYHLVRKEVEAGRQAYIVYPLVEESEKIDLEAAMQAAERLRQEEFPSLRVGLLHGRMKSEEKARVMAEFKKGRIQVLVATTVIEVGVDVPNASIMVIEHAERFGLAQLHQLRGRVGRGAHQSLCVLISRAGRPSTQESAEEVGFDRHNSPSPVTRELPLGSMGQFPVGESRAITQSARQRLKAMVDSADGFALAEQDLRLRGPGEFLGTKQWGVPEFRVLNLVRDAQLMEQARNAAFEVVQEDPQLQKPEHRSLKAAMIRRWQAKLDLGNVG